MIKQKRIERVAALSKILTDSPCHLFSFSYFCKLFGVAKSTLSEDVTAVKNGLEEFGLGKIETVSGAAGGVRYLPARSRTEDVAFLEELCSKLAQPERILTGKMLYTTDLLCNPETVVRLGEIIMSRTYHLHPDCIMTVETSGVPLAMQVARAFNVPLVMARHRSDITEGSTVNITYVSGSSKTIQTMALPKRALLPGSKVLIVDDVMKGGGTAKGMTSLAEEVGAQVVGRAFLITTAEPQRKLIENYTALFTLRDVDEDEKTVDIQMLP
ncbi:MAG: pur operon repressor [Acidaminococcaceae bacterium]|nr:pur operon repressor [Acidaminococcaceae bacterium]